MIELVPANAGRRTVAATSDAGYWSEDNVSDERVAGVDPRRPKTPPSSKRGIELRSDQSAALRNDGAMGFDSAGNNPERPRSNPRLP